MTNQEWIAKGNTGCAFATLFAKDPEKIGWKFLRLSEWDKIHRFGGNLNGINIISIDFPRFASINGVKKWALRNGFFLEETSDETEGLRILCGSNVSWVQYFGPDSHVKTRQSPTAMLMFTCRLNTSFYAKVGFHGILHLAHAWYHKISDRVYDLLWDRSHKQTEKKVGHKLGIKEAAKTTFLIEKDLEK